MLCSNFPLAIYFTYGKVQVLILLSQFKPPSPSLAVFIGLFFMSTEDTASYNSKHWLFNTAIVLLGIYPKEFIYTFTHKKIFIAALLTICKNCKLRCYSIGEWINKLCYPHTMEYSVQLSSVARVQLSATP